MSTIIIYDPITNYIKEYHKSANTPHYQTKPNTLINPDLSNGPIEDWIHESGSLRLMTEVENMQRVTNAKNKNKTVIRTIAEKIVTAGTYEGLVLRTIIEILMEEINTLRAVNQLPHRTKAELRTMFKNKIHSGDMD